MEFPPQGLANIAWAFATSAMGAEPLMHALAAAAIAQIKECTPQNLANIAWSCATLDFCDPPLIHALAASAMPRIR